MCNSTSLPGQPKLRHVVQRRVPYRQTDGWGRALEGTRTEIAREIAACRKCYEALQRGASLQSLIPAEEALAEESAPQTTVVPVPPQRREVRLHGGPTKEQAQCQQV